MEETTHGSGARLAASTRAVAEEAAALRRGVREALTETQLLLRSRLERHPYATLGLAIGTGYVLGGGIPRGIARWALDVSGRVLVTAVLHDLVSTSARR